MSSEEAVVHLDLLVQLPGEPSILAQVDLQALTQGLHLTGLNVGTGASAEPPYKYSILSVMRLISSRAD